MTLYAIMSHTEKNIPWIYKRIQYKILNKMCVLAWYKKDMSLKKNVLGDTFGIESQY